MCRFTHSRLALLAALATNVPTFAQNTSQLDTAPDLTTILVHNRTAYIPSQCYTKTTDSGGRVFNPCYVCHTRGRLPNYLDDSDLQSTYSFPAAALENPWHILRVARRGDPRGTRAGTESRCS